MLSPEFEIDALKAQMTAIMVRDAEGYEPAVCEASAMPELSVRSDESFQSGKSNLDPSRGGRIYPDSWEPLVFSAQPCKRYDVGFHTTQGPVYPFPKQNAGNPEKKQCPRQTCNYEQHSKKFLDNEETHFKPHSTGLLMTV